MKKLFVNVGCGDRKINGFLNVDINPNADMQHDITKGLPWNDNSVDGIYSEHFIEHISQADGLFFLRECYRVLVPGGIVRIATPDMDAIVSDYINNVIHPDWLRFGLDWVNNRCERINIAMRWWGHQWLYNEKELSRLSQLAGLRHRGRFALGESQLPVFRDLEHREGSRLIIEFGKPDFTTTTFEPPLVSVLIPAWNPRYFGEALSSVLSQTYQSLDIVICDDCRSSAIMEITNKLASDDQHVRYVHNPDRLGGRKNMLALLELAKGDFIKFLNDDDRLEPHCIERLLVALHDCPGATFATSRRQLIDADGYCLPDIIETLPLVAQDAEIKGTELATLLLTSGRNFIGEPSTVLIRKEALANIVPDPMSFDGKEIFAVNDIAMWINLALRGHCVYLVECLSAFRRHPEQRQTAMAAEVKKLGDIGLHTMRSAWERLGLARQCMLNHLLVRPVGSKNEWEYIKVNHFGVTYRFENAPLMPIKSSPAIIEDQTSAIEKSSECITGLRTIAFYLPQFHPIPENDQWWGKGFTEWRNVTKATPVFEGHYQPHLPSDLGFYDLRLLEVLEDQSKLARCYGIYGFCYYYYWFNGHRLLETPIDNMLKSGKPDFPFCLCWANENWTRRWDGGENDILMAQTYNEVNAHQIIRDLLPFLLDHRYIRVNNKPVLLVYRTDIIPDVAYMLNIWRSEAKAAGLIDLYLVRVESFYTCDPRTLGFDAACEFPPHAIQAPDISANQIKFLCDFKGNIKDYSIFATTWINRSTPPYKLFRGIMPSWDNTARRGSHATIFVKSSPEIYKNWLKNLVNHTLLNFRDDERLIFINAWNEWAEGCHLEPDVCYGHQFLEATQQALALTAPIDFEYCSWFKKHQWNSESSKILKKMSEQWLFKPFINILIIITEENQRDLLKASIGSLEKQTLDLWRLTVIAPSGFDYTEFPERTEISWVKTEFGKDARSLLKIVDMDSKTDWILICEPGTCLEPVFSNLVGELLNRNPEWRFIYTDEDCIDEQGNLSKPSLKPSSNLDLLRSSGYIGHACLTHSDLWRKISIAGRINLDLLSLNYAAALRCHEIFGEKAIGHIDEILFHYPLKMVGDLLEFEDAGKLILQECLWRQGIFAEVTPGLIKGSFFVDYPLFRTPLISIIIPTKNRLDLLQPCIESLLEKTSYPEYELIIIDNNSDCPETLKYLSYLKNSDRQIKVIPYSQRYNYSAINNLAAQKANGDYLLLLNNDTIIIQGNWLERLVSIGLREDVGVVGCRLVYVDQKVQHAGVIIGLGGVAEHIGIGLPINEAGHMGRAQLTQNFSAVTAACMLVRKSLFIEVGGLDEKDFAVLYNDVDLCLKIIERGYHIVWTPFATVVHHANSSLNANPDPKRNESNLRSRKNFIKKWMHRLGNDPAYNRHLSLRDRAWMIDGDFDVPWHPDLEPLPRIVAQPPDTTGVGQYRMIGPLKALTDSGRICSFLLPPINSEARFLPFPSELARVKPTVLFLQNAFSHWHIGEVESYAELLPDIFRVFGQDDIVFSVPQKSSVHKLFGKDTKARLRKVASLCHRVIVTTQPIADAMRGMMDDIRIMPNYLERSRWGDLQPPRKERRKLRVGWAGAQQHQGDLEFIIPVVEATANEVDWIFMGMSLPKLRYHIAELHGPVPFDEYPAGLAALDLDLAIAPLEINRFNAAKSNLRLLEYGAVGYPVICTDIEPYRNAPVTRVPNNPQAWIDAIRAHVHDMDATRAAGEQLHDWVLSDWMLDQHLDEWMKMLLPD